MYVCVGGDVIYLKIFIFPIITTVSSKKTMKYQYQCNCILCCNNVNKLTHNMVIVSVSVSTLLVHSNWL